MSACQRCGATGLDSGMTLCDPCLRELGTTMQRLEDQGIDTMNPDDPANPFAPPPQRPPSGGCLLAVIGLSGIPAGLATAATAALHLV